MSGKTSMVTANAGAENDRMRNPADHDSPSPAALDHRWFRLLAWSVLLLAALLQAWGHRHEMNPDGVSYLDLARAAAGGEWGETINGYWSPLYPWLLGIALSALQPNAFWEYTVAHLVNFGIFVLALAAFEFFLGQLLAARTRNGLHDGATHHVPVWVWRLLGYTAFGWATLFLNGLALVTPDLLVVVVVFAAAGIIIRLANGTAGLVWFAALGAILALGYLSKSAMLPLSAGLLVGAWFSGHPRRARGLMLAIAVLMLVAAPFVALLSAKRDRITVGDTGKLNYAWFVNEVQLYKHWHGDPPGSGTPRHPTILLQPPPTYTFAEPIRGTYPLWYDPSYWHDGLVVQFDPLQQLRKVAVEVQEIPWIVVDLFMPLVALIVLNRRGGTVIEGRNLLMLGAPLAVTLAMYSLVHIEPRFLAGFVGVFVAGLLLYARPRSRAGREALIVVMTAFAALLSTRVLEVAAGNVLDIRRQVAEGSVAHAEWVKAREVQRAGIRSGATIAFIGDGFRAYWAHLANYRITAEVAPPQFQSADPQARVTALAALAHSGTSAILADTAYACAPEEGWAMIPNTGLCSYAVPHQQKPPR